MSDLFALGRAEGVTRLRSGKVRELYAVGGDVLLVATDRISAFDVVLPTIIPDKGKVLTGLSAFWLDLLAGVVADHRITTDVDRFPAVLAPYREALRGRAMLCRRAEVLPVECVVRGYLSGSGWAEYQASGSVCGVGLPQGLRESERLPNPIFTPALKATDGHDENIDFDRVVELVGGGLAERVRAYSLRLYEAGAAYASERGLIVADTKFEFGLVDGALCLVDEVLTPDSSRLWPVEGYRPGGAQSSFDKQYVRDWLSEQGWDRVPPGPPLPPLVVERTRARYIAAFERLAGRPFADWAS